VGGGREGFSRISAQVATSLWYGGCLRESGHYHKPSLSPLQKLCRSFRHECCISKPLTQPWHESCMLQESRHETWHECCKLKTCVQAWHEGCIMQEACRSNVQNFDKAEVSSGRKLNTKTLMISTGYDELRHAVNYLNSSALSSSLEPRWTRRSLSSKSSESLGKMETSIFPQTDTILV